MTQDQINALKINISENEDQFQVEAIKLISNEFPELRNITFHPKNEGYIPKMEGETAKQHEQRKLREGNKNKAMGMKSGIHDIIIRCRGVMYGIELKMPSGTVSDAQKEMHANWQLDSFPINTQIVARNLYTVFQFCMWIRHNGIFAFTYKSEFREFDIKTEYHLLK